MQILGQDKDLIVNTDCIHAIDVYRMQGRKPFRILAWYGAKSEDCYGLGDYDTEDRAKEIIREIFQLSGQYISSTYGNDLVTVMPKIYEMPEE